MASQSSWTPGPWELSGSDDDGWQVWVKDGIPIADVRWGDNARLIAGAPELLEAGDALVDAVLSLAPSAHYPKAIQNALNGWVAARAKAEGRS